MGPSPSKRAEGAMEGADWGGLQGRHGHDVLSRVEVMRSQVAEI